MFDIAPKLLHVLLLFHHHTVIGAVDHTFLQYERYIAGMRSDASARDINKLGSAAYMVAMAMRKYHSF
jgi:hypothetical protein